MDRNRSSCWLAVCVVATACATGNVDTSPSVDPNTGASAQGGASAVPTWCEVRAVLERTCLRCHGPEPKHGAPFALVSYEDTQATNAKGKARYELIAAAVAGEYMPPSFLELTPSVLLLTEHERALLLHWCEVGAPGSIEPCETE